MLFKPEHVAPIREGRKTQTRRLWKRPMVKVGGTYWAETKMYKPESRFARLKVTRLWKERLGAISEADAKAEGYENADGYLIAFSEINHIKLGDWLRVLKQWVTCVEFEVV